MDTNPAHKTCSFCGLQGTADTLFAGGLGAMMCSDCVSAFHMEFSSEEGRQSISLRSRPRMPWDEMSDTELLSKLPKIAATATQVSSFLGEWVQLARERGLSWTEIGQAPGVSRRAARERFTKTKPPEANASA
ncbi:ClpX C4-type zinc finger protein [Nocardioides sp. B-3]|uniref:ClpX C4-type zinc finger protein n=1 Tax=Nocardioides sp. B-3 TaxID=2895565 RepID=UPI0021528725|nr:ClpX C4-type zinc finger protein [Nocardioides sp. B-3]UUZ59378.1 ClpX C4-type zinc finger protein [Nocardioides sp. B-3]